MRDYKYNCYKGAAFVIVGCLLFYAIQRLLAQEWRYPQFNENFYYSVKDFLYDDDAEVYFVGNSAMECSVSPMQIYDEYGILAYNAATSGQPIAGSKYMVEEIFKKRNPKVIVLEVSSLFSDGYGEKAYRYILDSTPLDDSKFFFILEYANLKEEDTFLDRLTKVVGVLWPLFNYHSRWESLTESDFNKNGNYFMRGYYLSTFSNPSHYGTSDERIAQILSDDIPKYSFGIDEGEFFTANETEDPTYNTMISEDGYRCLNEIHDMCLKHDCELLLIKLPICIGAQEYSGAWSEMKHNNTVEVASRLEVGFIDYAYGNGADIDWEHDTVDCGIHLNYLGAKKITSTLGGYLHDNYEFMNSQNHIYDQQLQLYKSYTAVADIQMSDTFRDFVNKVNALTRKSKVIISVKDDASISLSDEDKYLLYQLGCRLNFDDLELRNSYIAVIENGESVYECISNKKLEYTYEKDNNFFYVESAGYLSGNVSSICINGNEYAINGRGINIVVYDDESGCVIDSFNVDIFDNHKVAHKIDNNLLEFQYYLMSQ